jgi:hypothetical protein
MIDQWEKSLYKKVEQKPISSKQKRHISIQTKENDRTRAQKGKFFRCMRSLLRDRRHKT